MVKSTAQTKKSERVFLFHGEDDYTVAHKVAAWISAFEKKYSASGVITADFASDGDHEAAIEQAFSAGGLFSTTRLIVVKSLFAVKAERMEAVTELLDEVSDDVFVIFWESFPVKKTLRLYKKIAALEKDGRARIYAFSVPGGPELNRFIQKYALDHKIKISTDAIEKLAQLLGRDLQERVKTSAGYDTKQVFDLWQVVSELDKLGSFAGANAVTAADVAALVSLKISQNVFALTEALASRNIAGAQNCLDNLLDEGSVNATELKSKALVIVGALAQQFRSLIQLSSALKESGSEAAAAHALGWNPYRVRANMKLLHSFSAAEMKQFLGRLLLLDARLKSTPLPAKLLLTHLLTSIV